MKVIIFFGLFIITMVVLTGCDWYAIERIIYEDWLCTVNTDGTDLNYLRPAVGHHLVVTPDSERVIIFSSNHIYSMDIDGSNFITLNDSIGTFFLYPTPSVAKTPGGNKIILSKYSGNNHGDIYEIDLETNEFTNLTNTPDILEFDPHYSHDGTEIAYVTSIIPDSIITLSVMSYNGTNNRIIKEYNNPDSYDSFYHCPVFSHDDDKIFYIWSGPSTAEIDLGLHSVNIDGSNDQYLFEGFPRHPVSMPAADGSKIVFYSSVNIYAMNEDGSDLTNLSYADDYAPVISSDGSEILFEYGMRLNIMNSDGSERRQLIDDTLEDYCNAVFLPDNKVMCTVARRVQ